MRLHYSKITSLIWRKDKVGKPIRFSFKAVAKSNGEIIRGDDCFCSSYFIRTVNITFPSGQVRKLRKILFIEINGIEIIV